MSTPHRTSARRKLLLATGLAVAAIVGGTVASALPSSLNGQFGAGSVRLASAFSDDSVSITGTDGPDSLKRVIRTSIVVPSGKIADVQASFTGTIVPNRSSGSFSYCFGRFTVDSQTNVDPGFKPGSMQLLGGAFSRMPDQMSVAMNGFKKGIGPGTHYINLYVSSAYQGCQFQERTLNVVVNIR